MVVSHHGESHGFMVKTIKKPMKMEVLMGKP